MVRPTRANTQVIRRSSRALNPGDGGEVAHYRLPRRLVVALAQAALAGEQRSFAEDAAAACVGIDPPAAWTGTEHIPPAGACLVVCNHYTRPGLGAWWIALSISAAIAAHREPGAPASVHWVMTAAWRYPKGDWRREVITPATRWAFARAARVYEFVLMPPMPPDPDEVADRAAAVLQTLRLARRLVDEGGLLGLAPEGRDTHERLGTPPPGVGTFIGQLVMVGMPVLPVGVSEVAGRLRVSFGPSFRPEVPSGRGRNRRAVDGIVIERVMAAIAQQIPD